ncbi:MULTISPECIES: DUF2147 domain-containing protein [Acinetobacter]|jgi:uncharacterized protein (DUF2147 family)|uniref:DUF2147 domain-containing protein n=1 Tax=Acinetobacter chengduensis TaxID=2420890 RepID=A0ABX9U1D9_9GAMM|nr:MULTISPECIES: DUF2147 domain-containing protein [Acinetobacter]MBI1451403.1 DUF2147 domain-containing protein [Acinetobacter sp. FL51]RKG42075.1 DUF2147 domain-containing protein [Acinetobacter sp. WCHAc060007]RLL24663.1 DUF2147 domain-containing protein [Acinetobacter chengduensis]
MAVYKSIFTALVFSVISSLSYANDDPLVGKWKTIDDRTGYSRADVEIKKKPDGTYEGVIVETRNIPGTDKMVICSNCPGHLKDKPFLGLPFIWGFKNDPDNPLSYVQGKVLDPIGGKIYKGKARLNASGKRLTIRGYVGVSVIGRSVTWIKY